MMLEIDMGNTRLKWRLRQGETIFARGNCATHGGLEPLAQSLLSCERRIERVWVASVVAVELKERLQLWVRATFGVDAEFARSSDALVGVTNGYSQPERLGVDRWLALVAAYKHLNKACIVVSCGTAMTVDLVAARGQHLGGYIAPGFGLLAAALNTHTNQIAVEFFAVRPGVVPGCDTQSAVDAARGAMFEGLIRSASEYLELTEPLWELVLTGGDAELMQQLFPQSLVIPELVLDGLAYVFS